MNRLKILRMAVKPVLSVAMVASAQQIGSTQQDRFAGQNVASQLRPLGAPSAVDRYRNQSSSPRQIQPTLQDDRGYIGRQPIANAAMYRRGDGSFTDATETQYGVLQTQFELPFGASGAGTPEPNIPGVAPVGPNQMIPNSNSLRQLPQENLPQRNQQLGNQQRGNFGAGGSAGVGPPRNLPTQNFQIAPAGPVPQNFVPPPGSSRLSSDFAPLNQPALGSPNAGGYNAGGINAGGYDSGGFATLGNSRLVTPASCYSAAMAAPSAGCGPGYYAPAMLQPQSFPIAPQVVAPQVAPGVPLGAINTNPGPIGPLFTLGQERYPVQVGQGIIGQPKAYVQGQTIRNFFRYFTP